jgi:acyl carrier protein
MEEEIIQLYSGIVGSRPETMNSDLTQEFDSINFIHFISEIENKFNITFSEEEIEMKNFSTIDSIIKLIKSRQVDVH